MRKKMIEDDLKGRDIRDPYVLEAMNKVPRHRFVPPRSRPFAYRDSALPIEEGQTISQPYIVASMSQALKLTKQDKVLEIGTGSGYQAAVLGELAGEVYSIEIIPSLAKNSAKLLKALGYSNVHVKEGDGYKGWPEQAPFDAIIVTAAPPEIPQALIEQLKNPGGRMIVPVGENHQELTLIEAAPEGIRQKRVLPVRFVPMVKGT